MKAKIRIAIAANQKLHAHCVAKSLETIENFSVTGVFKNGMELVEFLKIEKVEIILLLELDMPELDGWRLLEHVKKNSLKCKTIVVSSFFDEQLMHDLISNGVNGFLCSTDEEWLSTLCLLIENKQLRLSIAEKGLQTVKNNYSTLTNEQAYLTAFKNVLNN